MSLKSSFKTIALLASLLITWHPLAAETVRVRSVKSLTHVLSAVEMEHGEPADFVTMKLQIYLEDVYISQGTTLYIRPAPLSEAIKQLLEEGTSKKELSLKLLRMFQDGRFYEQ